MATLSSPASESFAPFVARSLDTVAAENPRAYQDLCALLLPCALRLHVDGESLALRSDGRRIEISTSNGATLPLVRTSWQALFDLARGKERIEEALQRESLYARGRLCDLLSIFDALQVFVHAAARSSALSRLYLEFAKACARRGIDTRGRPCP